MRKIWSILLLLIIVLTGCEPEVRDDLQNAGKLNVSTHLLRLSDDSTKVAGNLVISASSPEIRLKWNVPQECNIDTTITTLTLNNGNAKLSVKWNECLVDSVYGPTDKAFDAGVLISTKDASEYVHLVWADQIDSTLTTSSAQVATRANGEMPKAIVLALYPELVPMDIVVGGAVFVDFSGTPVVTVDQTDIAVSTNIDKAAIPRFLTQPDVVDFKWTTAGAPDVNFTSVVTFTAGSIRKQATLVYNVPIDDPSYWLFVNSTPDSGSPLPATNASVVVTAKTNKDWSIESDDAIISPVRDNGGTPLGNKILTISITDNPNPTPRTITVLVKSQNGLKETLTFTQLGNTQTGVFDFLSSTPIDGSVLPGEETSVDIKVQTDLAWWIKCNCGKRADYQESTLGEKQGTITVTENTTGAPRVVTITIGHGETTVTTLNFVQNVSGGSGDDTTLNYDSSTLPVGNILAAGDTYTFIFTGTYTGNVQVRALIDGVAQAPGTPVTNKQPQVTVPANTLTTTRNLTFEYRREGGEWLPLPTATNRIQETENGGGDSGNISLITISPQGDIPESGETLKASFQGTFTGDIDVRATSGGQLITTSTGKVNSQIPLTIPRLDGVDRIIILEYSIDGGKNWLEIEQRKQINETFGAGLIQPRSLTIPAAGQGLSWTFQGTYSREATWRAVVNNEVLVETTSKGPTLSIIIPENTTGKNRNVYFMYQLDDGIWMNMEYRTQLAK